MNIVILSIGRSGSTIVAKMLEAMGWWLNADEEYAEHPWFRAINQQALDRGRFPVGEAEELLESLPLPWALKDPRFVWTWQHWRMVLSQRDTLLLWLTRDLAAIEKSLRRKNWGKDSPRGLLLRGRTLAEHHAECQRCFDAWGGPRMRVSFEGLKHAVALFDVTRG